ncbi:MAG TPA: hypothetical protein VE178_06715, partial [Silvibacterium sp.]|nr:hypothetical protein [Silvibacterium sp.]
WLDASREPIGVVVKIRPLARIVIEPKGDEIPSLQATFFEPARGWFKISTLYIASKGIRHEQTSRQGRSRYRCV